MCMTEPEVGTDVLGMRTRARRDGDVYVLDGAQDLHHQRRRRRAHARRRLRRLRRDGAGRAITRLPGREGHAGLRARPEVEGQARHARLVHRRAGLRRRARAGRRTCSASEGEGTLHMMRNLEIERLTLAAMSPRHRAALPRGDGRLRQRAQDASACRIREHGQIQRHIAESFAEYRAARALRLRHRAPPRPRRRPASASTPTRAKLFAAQVGKRVADAAIQVLGGYGYMGEYVVERLWRDAKLLEIGGGTLEAHQKNITRDLAPRSRRPRSAGSRARGPAPRGPRARRRRARCGPSGVSLPAAPIRRGEGKAPQGEAVSSRFSGRGEPSHHDLDRRRRRGAGRPRHQAEAAEASSTSSTSSARARASRC